MAKATKVKITVLRCIRTEEVFPEPPVHLVGGARFAPCNYFHEGQEIIVGESMDMPEGFCTVAWHTVWPTVRTLGFGGDLPWFVEKGTAINACQDGLRPVIFKLERVEASA
jgi:uncharacterized repeat protein (TIGR04076 family)